MQGERPNDGYSGTPSAVDSPSSSVVDSNRTSSINLEEETIEVLLCDVCRGPVASSRDILASRDEHASKEQVYSYELDLFENEQPVWAYSATNPAANRFDLVRVAPVLVPGTQLTSLVKCHCPYSDEQSFFKGYDWCSCCCRMCGYFLGWGFLRHEKVPATAQALARRQTPTVDDEAPSLEGGEEQQGPPPSAAPETAGEGHPSDSDEESGGDAVVPIPDFCGIIITRCTGASQYPLAQYEAETQGCSVRAMRLVALKKLRNLLLQFLGQVSTQSYHQLRFVTAFDRAVQLDTVADPLAQMVPIHLIREIQQLPPLQNLLPPDRLEWRHAWRATAQEGGGPSSPESIPDNSSDDSSMVEGSRNPGLRALYYYILTVQTLLTTTSPESAAAHAAGVEGAAIRTPNDSPFTQPDEDHDEAAQENDRFA